MASFDLVLPYCLADYPVKLLCKLVGITEFGVQMHAKIRIRVSNATMADSRQNPFAIL